MRYKLEEIAVIRDACAILPDERPKIKKSTKDKCKQIFDNITPHELASEVEVFLGSNHEQERRFKHLIIITKKQKEMCDELGVSINDYAQYKESEIGIRATELMEKRR